jgi:ATP-binding cassette subfamily B protein
MDAALKVFLDSGTYNLLIGIITAIGLSLVLYVGIGHVESGTLSLGALLVVNYYITQIYNPMRDLGRNLLDLQQAFAGMDRYHEVMNEQPDVPEIPNAISIARAKGQIVFENVSFSYDKQREVLHNISFTIQPGETLGVVGPTGSGKTTVSSLIMRFFDPTNGRITLDGTDLRMYKIVDLRNQFAVVLQDTVLFSTSVAENIRFARPEASMDEIVLAAKMANAHDFIMKLPNGYNTQVGERGMKLSGGERQRISIARAFLKNAPILLLDEPTSALDVNTESNLLKTLQELMKGRTTFMIAHRPSTLRNTTTIIQLDNGRLVKETNQVAAIIENMTSGNR